MDKHVLQSLLSEDATLSSIAEETGQSVTTVRYWLRKHGLKTSAQARKSTSIDKPTDKEQKCKHHGITTYTLEKDGRYRCKQCRTAAVQRRRVRLKELLVEYKGGKCENCGYVGHASVFDFHHIDPNEKDFSISARGHTRSLERNKEEVDKCMLLCANCHRLKHAGVW